MIQVVLIIHLILAVSIIALILLQRSEGGGLGIGGGGMGGFATPQSTANALTKATGVCAALFFITSMTLAVMAENSRPASIVDQLGKVSISKDAPKEEVSKEGAVGAEDAAAKADKVPSVPVAE